MKPNLEIQGLFLVSLSQGRFGCVISFSAPRGTSFLNVSSKYKEVPLLFNTKKIARQKEVGGYMPTTPPLHHITISNQEKTYKSPDSPKKWPQFESLSLTIPTCNPSSKQTLPL
jgi:hypothetical protein